MVLASRMDIAAVTVSSLLRRPPENLHEPVGRASNCPPAPLHIQVRPDRGPVLSAQVQIFGDPQGLPVLYAHGFPSAGSEAVIFHEAARVAGICLLAADRPGYGGTPLRPLGGLLGQGRFLRAVADGLGVRRCPILGMSGGGGAALAAARVLGRRCFGLVLVAPMGSAADRGCRNHMPVHLRLILQACQYLPGFGDLLMRGVLGPVLRRMPGLSLRLLSAAAPAADQALLQRENFQIAMRRMHRDAYAQGGRGTVPDLQNFVARWPKQFSRVKVPVELWHGEEDGTVTPRFAQFYRKLLPQTQVHMVPGEGHFSLPQHYAAEIVACLEHFWRDAGGRHPSLGLLAASAQCER